MNEIIACAIGFFAIGYATSTLVDCYIERRRASKDWKYVNLLCETKQGNRLVSVCQFRKTSDGKYIRVDIVGPGFRGEDASCDKSVWTGWMSTEDFDKEYRIIEELK